jgi:uncharacterized repeat protein (TIGR03803 family)
MSRRKHRFQGGTTDGGTLFSGLTLDAAGNLFGTTAQGGTYGCGTVFELTKAASWKESLLHVFACGTDGNYPVAGVTFDRAGNLYGTTEFGGIQGQDGSGIVFELSPSGNAWNETVLLRFGNGNDGAEPAGQLAFDRRGPSPRHNLRGRNVCVWHSLRSDFLERELEGKSAV